MVQINIKSTGFSELDAEAAKIALAVSWFESRYDKRPSKIILRRRVYEDAEKRFNSFIGATHSMTLFGYPCEAGEDKSYLCFEV